MKNLTTRLSSLVLAMLALSLIGCASKNSSAFVTSNVSDNVIGATTKEILVAESMRLPILKADPSLTDSQKQCIDEIDLTNMAKPVQGVLRKKFTKDELTRLDTFFDSDSAKAASNASRLQIASLLSGGEVTQGIKLTAKQEVDIANFTNSELGKKFAEATKKDGNISSMLDVFVTTKIKNCGI